MDSKGCFGLICWLILFDIDRYAWKIYENRIKKKSSPRSGAGKFRNEIFHFRPCTRRSPEYIQRLLAWILSFYSWENTQFTVKVSGNAATTQLFSLMRGEGGGWWWYKKPTPCWNAESRAVFNPFFEWRGEEVWRNRGFPWFLELRAPLPERRKFERD